MKKLTNLFLMTAWALALVGPVAMATDSETAAYFTADKITVTEVVPTAEEIASGYLIPSPAPQAFLDGVEGFDWNTMVLVGQKVIEIVKAGAPVVNIKRNSVSVMPLGIQNWQQLAGWQAPVTRVYNVAVTNYLGMKAVDLRLKVSGMWGGNVNGRGQYLANVAVVPVNTNVIWGWNLDLWTENSEPVNNGTLESPRAGLGFEIRYRAVTPLNELNGAQDYFITGDGKIQAL